MESGSGGEGGGPWRRRKVVATVTGRAVDLGCDGERRCGGDGEGGGLWKRRGAAASVTGGADDLGGDGQHRL